MVVKLYFNEIIITLMTRYIHRTHNTDDKTNIPSPCGPFALPQLNPRKMISEWADESASEQCRQWLSKIISVQTYTAMTGSPIACSLTDKSVKVHHALHSHLCIFTTAHWFIFQLLASKRLFITPSFTVHTTTKNKNFNIFIHLFNHQTTDTHNYWLNKRIRNWPTII